MHQNVDPVDLVRLITTNGVYRYPNFVGSLMREMLLDSMKSLHFTRAPEKYGKFDTIQNFDEAKDIPDNHLVMQLTKNVEQTLTALFEGVPGVFDRTLHFNQVRVQRYQPCKIGIGVHRDPKPCINLVAVVVIKGFAEFCTCEDRNASHTRAIFDSPGDLILMAAPGFAGRDIWPYHYVRNVESERITIGMRQNIDICHQ